MEFSSKFLHLVGPVHLTIKVDSKVFGFGILRDKSSLDVVLNVVPMVVEGGCSAKSYRLAFVWVDLELILEHKVVDSVEYVLKGSFDDVTLRVLAPNDDIISIELKANVKIMGDSIFNHFCYIVNIDVEEDWAERATLRNTSGERNFWGGEELLVWEGNLSAGASVAHVVMHPVD